jgi:5-methylcytosine-specific restriction endonuclease McrA
MNDTTFDWNRFHSYRVFDEFLEQFILLRKSYVTRHADYLDLEAAFNDIHQRFVAGYDGSPTMFEDKIANQFDGAPEASKIVFANIEYLWAMPMENLKRETKRGYGERWFSESDLLVEGERYFFGYPDTIADPGSWYLRNKYWEIVSLLGVLSLVAADSRLTDLSSLKEKIAEICHSAIHQNAVPNEAFTAPKFCAVHCSLMHLSDPERYESIMSASHRRQIIAVLGHVVEDPSENIEVLLKQIRETLYDNHGDAGDPDFKFRWFFYLKDVKHLWFDKKTRQQQCNSSVSFDIQMEEGAVDLEGTKEEVTGLRIRRSAKLVKARKEHDQYTCQACKFHFENQIVHVHHLDPVSELKHPKKTTINDLITLCPNCHYIAHYWLNMSPRYKERETLLTKLGAEQLPSA